MTIAFGAGASLIGHTSEKPSPDPTQIGRFFTDIDLHTIERDSGTTWDVIAAPATSPLRLSSPERVLNLSGTHNAYDVSIDLSSFIPAGYTFALIQVQVWGIDSDYVWPKDGTACMVVGVNNAPAESMLVPLLTGRTIQYNILLQDAMFSRAQIYLIGAL